MNKNNYGFTLIELLAVVVILALILLVAIPTVLDVISTSKDKAYESSVDLIENGSKLYFMANPSEDEVTIVQLISSGYLEGQPLDPRDNSDMEGVVILTTSNEGAPTYTYYSEPPELQPNYGTTTLTSYSEIYTNVNNYETPVPDCGEYDDYFSGNYQRARCLTSGSTGSIRLNQRTNNDGHRFTVGTHTYALETLPSDDSSWLKIYPTGACWTHNVAFGDIKLDFTDGASYHFDDAVANGYIEPLVIISASQKTSYSSFAFHNAWDVFDGGTTDTRNWGALFIFVKPKNKTLESITMYATPTSYVYQTCSDGLHVIEYPNLDVSISQADSLSY